MKLLDKLLAICLFTFFGYFAAALGAANGIIAAASIAFSPAGLLMVAILVAVSIEVILAE